jgi:hypothetical protein
VVGSADLLSNETFISSPLWLKDTVMRQGVLTAAKNQQKGPFSVVRLKDLLVQGTNEIDRRLPQSPVGSKFHIMHFTRLLPSQD